MKSPNGPYSPKKSIKNVTEPLLEKVPYLCT